MNWQLLFVSGLGQCYDTTGVEAQEIIDVVAGRVQEAIGD